MATLVRTPRFVFFRSVRSNVPTESWNILPLPVSKLPRKKNWAIPTRSAKHARAHALALTGYRRARTLSWRRWIAVARVCTCTAASGSQGQTTRCLAIGRAGIVRWSRLVINKICSLSPRQSPLPHHPSLSPSPLCTRIAASVRILGEKNI